MYNRSKLEDVCLFLLFPAQHEWGMFMHISIPIIPTYLIRLFFLFYDRLSSLLLFLLLTVYLYHHQYHHYDNVICDKAMVQHHWIRSWVFCPYIQVSWDQTIAIYQHLSTLMFRTHSSPTCSPITDSNVIICGLLIPCTVSFRTLKLHVVCLCIVLCLLISTHCLVDEPAQFPFPFSLITPSVFLALHPLPWNYSGWISETVTNDWTSVSAYFLKLWTGLGKATCQHPYNRCA